jgi:molecular chaperone Hsp33
MPDSLRRFLIEATPVRGEIAHLDATWRAVLERRRYPPPLEKLLGEMMAAAALLSATLKFDGSLIMQMQGSGPVQLLVVEATSEHTLRATAKWEGELPDGNLKALLGDGRFVISIVPESGKQTYQGVVDLQGETIAEVLEHYMAQSEQLETRLWLASDSKQAGGMLLQKLPATADTDADAWNRAIRLGATIRREELLALPATEIIRRLYHEEDVRVFEPRPVSFRCSCSGTTRCAPSSRNTAPWKSTASSAAGTIPSIPSMPSRCSPPSTSPAPNLRSTNPEPQRREGAKGSQRKADHR